MTGGDDILARIVATKREEVAAAKKRAPLSEWQGGLVELPPPRDFKSAIRRGPDDPVRVIAEVKQGSPSKGIIRADFDPVSISRAYEAGGAAALSVLTDEKYFLGHLENLEKARTASSLPLLRKDFIIDSYQVYEARLHGADAILLIASILSDGEIFAFQAMAQSLGMAALVEVHTEDELDRVVLQGAEIVGINNRNLSTFETDLATTLNMADGIPDGIVKVSESGIFTHEQVRKVGNAGVDAVLVGESLMRQENVEQALKALLEP